MRTGREGEQVDMKSNARRHGDCETISAGAREMNMECCNGWPNTPIGGLWADVGSVKCRSVLSVWIQTSFPGQDKRNNSKIR